MVRSWNFHKILGHKNTNLTQIPPRTETGLIAEGQHAVDWTTGYVAARLHLSLLTHKRVEFGLRRFHLRSPHPAKFKQPIQQLPKEMESGIVVAPNHNFRAKTTKPLTNLRPRSNCWENGAHQILQKTTAVPTELFAEKAAINFFKGYQKTRPLQEVFFADCPKTRMIRKHVCLPLLNNGKINAQLHFLQKAIYKSGEFTECQVSVISPSRVQFGETVCN